jgi:hypothetical protein
MLEIMREPPAFEVCVRQDAGRILHEASEFFMERGTLHQALRDLARHLDDAGIPYAVMGAIALGQHGLPRMTLDIDVLLTAEGLQKFRERYVGRGYTLAFPGAEKTFRAAETGVRIEVITTGEYPGDGRPKPVQFPDPAEASVERGGIQVLRLERLIELKLASGMTASHRLRDLADVQDLIRTLSLKPDFAQHLDSSVRPTYLKLWGESQAPDQLQGT